MPKPGTILTTTDTTTHITGEATTTMESVMPDSGLKISNSTHVISEISEGTKWKMEKNQRVCEMVNLKMKFYVEENKY